MSVAPNQHRYSVAEYLARERDALEKHEYRAGEILLMAGGSENHSLIVMNFSGELRHLLKGKPCRVFESNFRIRIPSTTLYTYPDASVICGPSAKDPDDASGGTATNPRVIVEVLSPSTEAYDRGEKFDNYRRLGTLEDYILVSQNVARVEVFSRKAGGDSGATWQLTWFSGLETLAKIPALALELPLAEIYRGVELPVANQAG